MSVNREILWVKCQTIAENSLYTAQGHFEDAHLQTVVAQWLLFTPAIVSFLAGAYILFGAPPLVGVFALLGGLASGLATALGVSHGKDRHIQAANAFTVLRHDADALRITFGPLKTDEELVAAVAELHNRYNTLIQVSEPVSDKAFARARTRIHEGLFEPDGTST